MARRFVCPSRYDYSIEGQAITTSAANPEGAAIRVTVVAPHHAVPFLTGDHSAGRSQGNRDREHDRRWADVRVSAVRRPAVVRMGVPGRGLAGVRAADQRRANAGRQVQLVQDLGKWPALRPVAAPDKCPNCQTCTPNCPMSVDVNAMVERADMEDSERILCGSCVDGCTRGAIRFSFSRQR
jgi:Pyruvate/2-oxoacid:ferredoxin oxidoreductase delta subunit